jgi:hypothetical protein
MLMTNYDLDHQKDDSHAGETGAPTHLTVVDIVLLLGLALGGFFAAEDRAGNAPTSDGRLQHAPATSGQPFCSDEELRLMRSGPEACYDAPHSGEHDNARKPTSRPSGNS